MNCSTTSNTFNLKVNLIIQEAVFSIPLERQQQSPIFSLPEPHGLLVSVGDANTTFFLFVPTAAYLSSSVNIHEAAIVGALKTTENMPYEVTCNLALPAWRGKGCSQSRNILIIKYLAAT